MRFGKIFDSDAAMDDMRQSMLSKFLARKSDWNDDDESPGRKKIAFIVGGIALALFSLYLAGFIVMIQKESLPYTMMQSPLMHFVAGITSIRGWLYALIFGGVVSGIAFIVLRKNGELDVIKGSDSRGVDYSSKGTYGTAEWMSRKEAKEEYEICHIDDARGVILGQYTEGGKEVVCLPENTKGNRNILVLGSPGTGKSFCYVRNAIFQAIVRGESVVITDPKGELYESTSEKLRLEGYKVQVFNLVSPQRSDAWNCISEIYDPETGDISEVRTMEFVDALMKNTAEGGKDDHFWGTAESNLLKAVVMFCAWRREMALKGIYEAAGKEIAGRVTGKLSDEDMAQVLQVLESDNPDSTMRERERAMRILIQLDTGIETVTETMKGLKDEAPDCDIATICFMLITNDLAAMEEKFKAVPLTHPAGLAWSIFKNGGDNVRPNIIQGLAQRLQLFQMPDIQRITANDEIVLEELGSTKTALFCIISDKSTAMRVLTSLFFTFLFKDVSDAADRFGPQNRLPVNVICDEFANLGTIPSFDVTISTVRSRKINISIILQSVMQLEKNYMEARETIISCCDTILFLGCNDIETANFMSDLSGVASIRVFSTKDSRSTSLGNRTMMQGYQIGEGDGKRNLMNPDEIRRLSRDDVLIYHNGRNLLEVHRCGYIEHRFYREGLPPDVHLRDYPLASKRYKLPKDFRDIRHGDVSSMTERNRDISAAMSQGIELETVSSDSGAFSF